MNTRKLVKSGHSSLVVAMPMDWIKRNNLKPGDTIYIEDDNDKLNISTSLTIPKLEKKEKVIITDGKTEREILHEISSAYMDNFFHIIIKGKNLTKFSKRVKEHVCHLIAVEVVEELSDKIVAKSFLNIYDSELKTLVRRMDNIVRSMIIDTSAAVKDLDLVQNIIERDVEINRLYFLVFKILKAMHTDKQVLISQKMEELDVLRYWELNIHLEKIGDRVKNIAATIPQLNPSRKKRFLELFSQLAKLYNDVMKAFYNRSSDDADKISVSRVKLLANIQIYMKKNGCAVCNQIAINAFNMAGHINDIARIVRYLN